jgi:hypothetical protein
MSDARAEVASLPTATNAGGRKAVMTKRLCSYGWLVAALLAPACVTRTDEGGDDDGIGDDDAPPPPEPDAGPPPPPQAPECEHETCGTNGDTCCEGTVCTNFALTGDVECAWQAPTREDCESNCTIELENGDVVCAPWEYCDTAGPYPEYLCQTLDYCDLEWTPSEDTCVAWEEQCLETHTDSEQLAWMSWMHTCLSQPTCGDFQACLYEIPFCW